MNRWKIALSVLGLAISSIAVSATSVDDPVRLSADQTPSAGSGQKFNCGAYCNGVWINVGSCWEPQKCCGYIYCSNGVGQNTCCNPGTICNYDRGAFPPTPPKCLAIGGGPH